MEGISKEWIGGFFDADGNISYSVLNQNQNYILQLVFQIGQSRKNAKTTIPCIEKHFINNMNISPNINSVREGELILLTITDIKNVKTVLEYLQPHIHGKSEQVKIVLEEIIPRMEQGLHNENKTDFIELIAWKEALDSYKGGNRSKYTVEYFEEKWDIELPENRKPSIEFNEKLKLEGYSDPVEEMGSLMEI